MKVKSLLRIASVVILFSLAIPASSSIIVPTPVTVNNPPPTEDPRVQQILLRLQEIKGMDKAELSRMERKELRKEVKEIKKEMKAIKGGVYLSVGAIIIIILLLILIL